MTHEQKLQVKSALLRYIESFNTQQQAAESLQDVSPTIVSQIKNDNWGLLSDRLWQHVARQVGFYCGEWHVADTCASLLLNILFNDAQNYAMAYGVAISDGLGKTFTAKNYQHNREQVYYMSCTRDHNRRTFMTSLMQCAGMDDKGTMPELINTFIARMKNKDLPLLILDDAQLLNDRVMHLLVMLTNALAGAAGIVMMGNDELRLRITSGTQIDKPGYDKVYSTFGRRFITLGKPGPNDVEMICKANGVDDGQIIAAIASECKDNLHPIVTLVEQYKTNRIAA